MDPKIGRRVCLWEYKRIVHRYRIRLFKLLLLIKIMINKRYSPKSQCVFTPCIQILRDVISILVFSTIRCMLATFNLLDRGFWPCRFSLTTWIHSKVLSLVNLKRVRIRIVSKNLYNWVKVFSAKAKVHSIVSCSKKCNFQSSRFCVYVYISILFFRIHNRGRPKATYRKIYSKFY